MSAARAGDPRPLDPALARRRAAIAAAQGRIRTVTFTKKHGTTRRRQVRPAALRLRLKDPRAAARARRAATRAARHPHLLPVRDLRARAPRPIDLRRVSRIAADRRVHHCPAVHEG